MNDDIQTESKVPETVTITFTKEQMGVLNVALMERPYREAAPLINHINEEISKQVLDE